MKHLARAEWILQNLRGIQLEQDDEVQQQEVQNEDKMVHELVKQGIDPMMELYDPDKNKQDDKPDIRGIDWRGEP